MKKPILIAFLLFLLIGITGCGFIKNQKINFETCMADAECKSSAESWQDRVETATAIAVAPLPLPGASAAPKVSGYIALVVAALIGGSALRKKQTNV